jgi:putative FmdB family regulatory protein
VGAEASSELPLYEYQCPKCGRFELIRKFSDATLTACPTCGSEVQKLLSAPAIQFKGTGWYITDYARKDGKSGTGDSSQAPSGKSDGGKSEGGKSEGGKSEGGKSEGGKSEGGKSDGAKSEGAKSESAKASGSSSGDKAAAPSTPTATKDSGGKT